VQKPLSKGLLAHLPEYAWIYWKKKLWETKFQYSAALTKRLASLKSNSISFASKSAFGLTSYIGHFWTIQNSPVHMMAHIISAQMAITHISVSKASKQGLVKLAQMSELCEFGSYCLARVRHLRQNTWIYGRRKVILKQIILCLFFFSSLLQDIIVSRPIISQTCNIHLYVWWLCSLQRPVYLCLVSGVRNSFTALL